MREVWAYVDVDETLLRVKSMLFMLGALEERFGVPRAEEVKNHLVHRVTQGDSRETLNRLYCSFLSGLPVDDVRHLAREHLAGVFHEDVFNRSVYRSVGQLCEQGVDIALVSGSPRMFVEAVAEAVSASDIIATELAVDSQGGLTGELSGPCMLGEAKARAVADHMQSRRVFPERCYAFGDDATDEPFLALVGNPRVVPNDPRLLETARRKDWVVLEEDEFSEARDS